MKKTMTIAAALGVALTLTACGGDPNDDNHINGMGKSDATVACQKHLAKNTPGVELGDFSAVSASKIRKITSDGVDVWQIQDNLNGRAYQCTVSPTSATEAAVDGAFAQ